MSPGFLGFMRRAIGAKARVMYGVEVGSISETSSHVTKLTFWYWGVDTMPLMDHGGRPPSGQALTLDDAKAAFRQAFLTWLDDLPAGVWERNRDYKDEQAQRAMTLALASWLIAGRAGSTATAPVKGRE